MTRFAHNLFDVLADELEASGATALCENVEMRHVPESYADMTLRFSGAGWKQTPAGCVLLDRLAAAPWCLSSRAKGGRLTLRIADGCIAEIGAALERGARTTVDASGVLAGQRRIVDFYGANTTKALHVGHLRNLALGHAYASALRAAGASVITQSSSSDFGRQMAEAAAGYVLFRDGETPDSAGMKSDHFVGDCYSRYVARLGGDAGGGEAVDAPIAREIEPIADLADEHLARLRAGDDQARALWSRLRDWAVAGQDLTLARLGVLLDRKRYESGMLGLGERIVADGLARGILQRTADGSLVFKTGRSEYRQMLLVRRDGLPTAHLRDFICLGMLMRAAREPLDAYVQFCGSEWNNAVTVYRQLLAQLHPAPFNEIHHMVFHGLVTQAGAKVSSSSEEPLLADDVLDRVAASPHLGELLAESKSSVTPQSLVALVTLGHFASFPPAAPVEFSLERFVAQRDAAGWLLASAFCRAHGSDTCRNADPDPVDAAYRFSVLQSQRLPRIVESVASSHDPSRIARYLVALSRFYLDTPRSPRLDRVMRTVLHAGLDSLGLVPALVR